MADKEEVIKTDVDKLIRVLKENKVITMSELSKKMNLPFKTIESLTGLLEEERMVHITYKFTTPYVHYGPPKTKGKSAKDQKKTEGEKALFAMEQEIEKTPKREMPEAEISKRDKSDAEKKEEAKKGKEEKDKEKKGEKEEGAGIGDKTGKLEKEKEPEGKKKEGGEDQGGKPELVITDNIEELVEKANKLVHEGDLEGAREIYLTIKRKKSDLPKEFIEKEKKLKEHLLKLNEVLILGMDKAVSSEFTKKYEEIQQIFSNIEKYMKDNKISSREDLEKVENLYANAKDIYLNMPEGFVERRVEIQDKLLEFYKAIIANKKTILTEEFKKSSEKIGEMLKSAQQMMAANNIEEAGKTLNNINKAYISLPSGFLKEKTELQNKLLELYQKLILNKETEYAREMQQKTAEIKPLISKAMEAVKEDDIDAAKNLYVNITDIYSGMPQGFLESKAKIESEMIDLYHLISLQLNKTRTEEIQEKASKIKKLMKTAGEYIAAKDFDLAKESYMEIIALYNKIPKGYSGLPQLRSDILDLYKAIMPSLIEAPPTDADEESMKKYNEMLKLLVQIHEAIKNRDFEVIKPKYLMAYKLYHEMPIGFLEGRTNIYDQLSKAYEELKLYTEVNRLPELANSERYDELKASLDSINSKYSEMIKKYPEDMELFDYVKDKYLIYLNLLKKHFGQIGESGREVRERIEDLSQRKDLQGETLPEDIRVEEPAHAQVLKGIPEEAVPADVTGKSGKGSIPNLNIKLPDQAEEKQG